MKLMVPTFWCEAMLTEDIYLEDRKIAAGEIIRLPYGVAIQAYARGSVSVIKDAENTHIQAERMLAQYGPDCWFPQPLQTLAKVEAYLNEQGPDQNAPSSPLVH